MMTPLELKRVLEVERTKIEYVAGRLEIRKSKDLSTFGQVTRSSPKVARSLHLILGIFLSHHSMRETWYNMSPELEWMRMEETQIGSAAAGCGGLGPDDTTMIEVVEPSSFEAAGHRLLVHLNSWFKT